MLFTYVDVVLSILSFAEGVLLMNFPRLKPSALVQSGLANITLDVLRLER